MPSLPPHLRTSGSGVLEQIADVHHRSGRSGIETGAFAEFVLQAIETDDCVARVRHRPHLVTVDHEHTRRFAPLHRRDRRRDDLVQGLLESAPRQHGVRDGSDLGDEVVSCALDVVHCSRPQMRPRNRLGWCAQSGATQ